MSNTRNVSSISLAQPGCGTRYDNYAGSSGLSISHRQKTKPRLSARDYGCKFSIATLSAVTKLPGCELQAATRSTANIAFARQIAMYLAHTKFGITYSDVGAFFRRDRSTVAHACQLVEDRRDDTEFDDHLNRMEVLIDLAMPASLANRQSLASTRTGTRYGGVA